MRSSASPDACSSAVAMPRRPPAPGSVGARILPFEWLRRFIAPKLTRAFLRDVNDFLYAEERRKAMEQSVIDRLAAGGGPFVVIGHSQGSMIAYDVLRQLDPRASRSRSS